MAKKEKPTQTLRYGAIRANIWTNSSRNDSDWFSFTAGRLYKDEHGNWQESHSYKLKHLPDLQKAVEHAQRWMQENVQKPELPVRVVELDDERSNGQATKRRRRA